LSTKKKPVKTGSKQPPASRHSPGKSRPARAPWLWIGLGLVILAAAAFLLLRPKSPAAPEISVVQAYEKYQQGIYFIDVRTQEEWDQGHIDKTTLIPLDDLESRLGELPRDQEIVVVCRSGRRSKQGVAILQQAGFSNVASMSGGVQAWETAGYPLIK
jgi:rhodanese-related sulfurtransferase